MTIIDEIRRCSVEYKNSTGVNPTRVYLGRGEMLALGKWAYDAGYITDPTLVDGEGKERTEVMGLMVYKVNDDEPHMRCCV